MLGELICSRLLSLDGGVDLCEGATRATTRTSSIHGTPAAAEAAAAAAAADAAEAIEEEEEGGSGDLMPCAAAAAAACATGNKFRRPSNKKNLEMAPQLNACSQTTKLM